MTDAMKNAINNVMNRTNPWEMSRSQKQNLSAAQNGNAGALCDLLASLGLENNPAFDEFYYELNQDSE